MEESLNVGFSVFHGVFGHAQGFPSGLGHFYSVVLLLCPIVNRMGGMLTPQEKISLTQKILEEEFAIGSESSAGLDPKTRLFHFYTRDLLTEDLEKRSSLGRSQLFGILDLLQEKDFILGYGDVPDAEKLIPGDHIRILYPLSFESGVIVEVEDTSPVVAEVRLDKKKLYVLHNNNEYLLKNLDLLGANKDFFEYVFNNAGRPITEKEVLGGTSYVERKSFQRIATELGFSGTIRQAFFPAGLSTKGLIFRKRVTQTDLDEAGIEVADLQADLRKYSRSK